MSDGAWARSTIVQRVQGIVNTFAKDAYVNDNRREIVGIDTIRRWLSKEIVGDKVTMDVREVIAHYENTIVPAVYDGECFDETDRNSQVASVADESHGKIVCRYPLGALFAYRQHGWCSDSVTKASESRP
jgi:hypothetical protein